MREHEGRVFDPHGPDLLTLGAAAHEGEPIENRVSPARIDGGDELDVDGEDVLDGVDEALDDLVDLLEHFGGVVGAQLGAGRRKHRDLVTVPFGQSCALEDPVDDRFLGIRLVAGGGGVARDLVPLPLKSRLGRERAGRLVARAWLIVAIVIARHRRERLVTSAWTICGLASAVPRGSEVIRPPNIDTIRAVRRFMPGGLLAALARADNSIRGVKDWGVITEDRI